MFTDKEMLRIYLEMQKILKPTLSIEVGAFDADYSKEMSKTGIECFAFEASPFVYKKFKDQMGDITYINKAVSDKNGVVKFESTNHQNPSVVGYNGIKNRKAKESYSYIDIESVTLNSYFKDREKDKVSLWIDCEGANQEVLMGSTNILPSVESILIETEDIELWDKQWLHDDVVKFLRTFGFEIVHEKKAYDHQRNVIFAKNVDLFK